MPVPRTRARRSSIASSIRRQLAIVGTGVVRRGVRTGGGDGYVRAALLDGRWHESSEKLKNYRRFPPLPRATRRTGEVPSGRQPLLFHLTRRAYRSTIGFPAREVGGPSDMPLAYRWPETMALRAPSPRSLSSSCVQPASEKCRARSCSPTSDYGDSSVSRTLIGVAPSHLPSSCC